MESLLLVVAAAAVLRVILLGDLLVVLIGEDGGDDGQAEAEEKPALEQQGDVAPRIAPHSSVESPDFIPNPGVLETLLCQLLLQLEQLWRVLADGVGLVVWNLDAGMTAHHNSGDLR